MFHFVTDKEFLDASRAFCSRIMCRTRDLLHEEDINSQPVLVGSGARNLVTTIIGSGIRDFQNAIMQRKQRKSRRFLEPGLH